MPRGLPSPWLSGPWPVSCLADPRLPAPPLLLGGGNSLITNTIDANLPTRTDDAPSHEEEVEDRGWDFQLSEPWEAPDNNTYLQPCHIWVTKDISEIIFPSEIYTQGKEDEAEPFVVFGTDKYWPELDTHPDADGLQLYKLTFPATLKYTNIYAIERFFPNSVDTPKIITMNATEPPTVLYSPDKFDSDGDGNNQFDPSEEWLESTTLRVPYLSLEAYKNDPDWGKFKNIEPIETVVDLADNYGEVPGHVIIGTGWEVQYYAYGGWRSQKIVDITSNPTIVLKNSKPDAPIAIVINPSRAQIANLIFDNLTLKGGSDWDGQEEGGYVEAYYGLYSGSLHELNITLIGENNLYAPNPLCGLGPVTITENSTGVLNIYGADDSVGVGGDISGSIHSTINKFPCPALNVLGGKVNIYGGLGALGVYGADSGADAPKIVVGSENASNALEGNYPEVFLNYDDKNRYAATSSVEGNKTYVTVNSGKLHGCFNPEETTAFSSCGKELAQITIPGMIPGKWYGDLILSEASAANARYENRADENGNLIYYYAKEEIESLSDEAAKQEFVAGKMYTVTGKKTVQGLVDRKCSDRGTVEGGGFYEPGAEVTLEAKPDEGNVFAGWSDGNTDNPRTITVPSGDEDALLAYTAIFKYDYYTVVPNSGNVEDGCKITDIDWTALAGENYDREERKLNIVIPEKFTIDEVEGYTLTEINLETEFDPSLIPSKAILSLTIPASVKKISAGMFILKNNGVMTCLATEVPEIEEYLDYEVRGTNLHVPAVSREAYKEDENWGKFDFIYGVGELPESFTATIEDMNLKVNDTHQHSYLLSDEAAAACFHPGPELPTQPEEEVNALAEDTSASQPMGTHSWESDNTDVAEVDANGFVTAKKEGDANIKVTITSPYYEQPIVATSAIRVDVATGVAELTVAADENVTVYDLNGVSLHTGAFGDMPRLALHPVSTS